MKEESRHTSRVFVPITEDYDSRHITCLSHLKMFVESMSSTTRCVRKLQDGYVCGGTYKLRKVVRKGVGGELLAQASCTRCNFKVNYGDPGFSPSSSLPTKMSIGRELVLSYILVGRPLHTWYKKMFGSFGMDSYSDKTFHVAIQKVADAVEERQRFEVIIHTPSHSCIIHSHNLTHNRSKWRRNICSHNQEIYGRMVRLLSIAPGGLVVLLPYTVEPS